MKIFLTLLSVLLMAVSAHAASTVSIQLAAPAGIEKEACPVPIWKNLTASWKGVRDSRSSQEIGLQTQKGKEPIQVISLPALDLVFDASLKNLLTACGMKLTTAENGSTLNLSAEIKEFYAGVEKKLLTGKGVAKSSITFIANRGGTSSSVTVGYEMESKKIRSGDIKQLTKTINDLFAETLKQIPATEEMKDLK